MQFKLLLKVHHDANDLTEEETKILLPLIDRLIKLKKTNLLFKVLQYRLTIENNQFVFDKETKDILIIACEKQHRGLIEFIFKNYLKADAVENIPLYIQLLINFAKNNLSELYKFLSSLIPLSPLELVTLPLITLLSKQALDDKKNLDGKAIQFLLKHGCRVTATSFMKLISRNIDTVAEELILSFLDHTDNMTVLQTVFDKYLITAFKLKWFVMPQQIPSVEDFIKIIEVSAHQRNPVFSKVIKKFIENGCHAHEFLNNYRSVALAKKIGLASSVDAIFNPVAESNIAADSKSITTQNDDSISETMQRIYQDEIDRACERGIYGTTPEKNRQIANLSIEELLRAAEEGDYILINDFIRHWYLMESMFRAKRGSKYKVFYDHIVQKTLSHNFFIKAFENNFNELKNNFEMYAFNLERAVTKLKDRKSFETIIEGMLDNAFMTMKFATREKLIKKVKHFRGPIFSDDSEMLNFYLRIIIYSQLQEAIKYNNLQHLQHLLRNYKDILILKTQESKQLSDNPSQNRLHESVNLYSLVVNFALPDDILYASSMLGFFSVGRNADRDNTELSSIRNKFLKHAFILDRFIKAYSSSIEPEMVYTIISNFPGIEELVLRFLVSQPDSSAILQYLVEHDIHVTEECVTLALEKGHYTYAVILAGTSTQLQKKLGKLSNAQEIADAWDLTVQEYMDYQFKAEQKTFYGASENVANDILPFLETAKYIEQDYVITDEDRKNAMNLAILFGSLENTFQYCEDYSEKHSDNHHPIHDACLFHVPQKGLWHIPIWRKLVFKYGDTIIRYVRLAPAIETLLYSDDIPLSLLKDNLEKQYRKDFYEKYRTYFAAVYDADMTQEKMQKVKDERQLIAMARVTAKHKDKLLSDVARQGLIEEELSTLQKKSQDEREGYIQQQTENQIKLMIAKEIENILLARLQKICLFVTRNDSRYELQRIDLLNLSLSAIKELIAKICYKRGDESPELAARCVAEGLDERLFEKALELKKTFKTYDFLPDIFIDGSDIGEPNYYMVKLPANDDRGLMLGVDTHSCQSLGFQGADVAINGKTSLFSTFYVVMKKPVIATNMDKYKDEIFGQCYAWISTDGNICFCSLEARRPQLGIKFAKFYNAAAKKLIGQKVTLPSDEKDAKGNDLFITKEIQRVTVGQGGGTPKEMGWPIATNPEVPLPGEVAHPDSKYQWILADNAMNSELECESHKPLRPPLSQ